MTNGNAESIEILNEAAPQRFKLQLELEAEKSSFKSMVAVLKTAHIEQTKSLQAEIDALDEQLWQNITHNRASLIVKGKRSFVTMCAKFQFRTIPSTTKVVDAVAVMEVARKLGVVRKIAKPTNTWKLSNTMFFQWLSTHDELRHYFEPHIDDSPKGESLTMQPNDNYTVRHNSKRISPPSVTIHRASPA